MLKNKFVRFGLWAVAGVAVVFGAAGLLFQDGPEARADWGTVSTDGSIDASPAWGPDRCEPKPWDPAPKFSLEEWFGTGPVDDDGCFTPNGARLEEW